VLAHTGDNSFLLTDGVSGTGDSFGQYQSLFNSITAQIFAVSSDMRRMKSELGADMPSIVLGLDPTLGPSQGEGHYNAKAGINTIFITNTNWFFGDRKDIAIKLGTYVGHEVNHKYQEMMAQNGKLALGGNTVSPQQLKQMSIQADGLVQQLLTIRGTTPFDSTLYNRIWKQYRSIPNEAEAFRMGARVADQIKDAF